MALQQFEYYLVNAIFRGSRRITKTKRKTRKMPPVLADASEIVMLEIAELIEVEARAFFAISISNSLQKSSAIQKFSVTLLSVIMIGIL